MKPDNVRIIHFHMERMPAYGPYNGDVMEIYGLGDDGVIYFYDDEEKQWGPFLNL